MAKVKIIVRGKLDPSPLYVRYMNGRHNDFSFRTGIYVNPSHWDNSTSNYRNLKEIPDRSVLNARFDKLRVTVIEKHNELYMTGEIADKAWLERVVNDFWGRPKQEKRQEVKKHYVYFIDFAKWWLTEKAPTWKTGKNKFMDHRAVQQYSSFLQIWIKFSGTNNYKIKDIDSILITKFIDYVQDNKGYSASTIKRWVGRLRFFLLRAQTFNIKVAPDFQDRVHVGKEEEIVKPYLTESEINAIFALDYSKRPIMDACRDYLVLSCYTGFRISDLITNLSTENIKNGYIELKTQKTGSFVKLPIHPKVKAILDKRFGNLPQKVRKNDYNSNIKSICRRAGINTVIFGKKWDNKTKRGVVGHYPKYELITSHSGRRTLASLLSGKVPKELIAAIGGWAQTDMVDFYNKTTKTDYADRLAEYWAKNE